MRTIEPKGKDFQWVNKDYIFSFLVSFISYILVTINMGWGMVKGPAEDESSISSHQDHTKPLEEVCNMQTGSRLSHL